MRRSYACAAAQYEERFGEREPGEVEGAAP